MMRPGLRSSLFRIFRTAVVVLLLIAAGSWLRRTLTSLESEQAVINAEIIQIRTPITGELVIGDVRPGMLVKKGDVLFEVRNARFGDRESVAQYNGLQNLVESVQAELLGAKNEHELAEIASERTERLWKAQLIPRIEKEQAAKRVVMAKALVAAKEEQLTRSRERTAEMEKQMEMQKASIVTIPEDGLIWSITGKSGEQVDSNKLVMEVLNPTRIWVDAFFAERHAQELRPGLPAKIRSLDSTLEWSGNMQSIRAGVGRFAYDTTVAVPPPEMAKRMIAVRVEAGWDRPFSPVEFYGVGRSVEVRFLRGKHQRTVGDVLQERWKKALTQGGWGETVSAGSQ